MLYGLLHGTQDLLYVVHTGKEKKSLVSTAYTCSILTCEEYLGPSHAASMPDSIYQCQGSAFILVIYYSPLEVVRYGKSAVLLIVQQSKLAHYLNNLT